MNTGTKLTLTTMALLCLAVAPPAGDALAQQRNPRVSFTAPAANSKFTQQHDIDVADQPGHQVRVFEIHRTFPSNAPVINGEKLADLWSRGASAGHATQKKNDDWLAAHPKETADSAPDKANPGDGVVGRVMPPARLLRRARVARAPK